MLPSRIWCLPPGLKEINWNLRMNWATCYVDPTWPCLWSLESVLHKWLQVQARGCGEWFISSLHRRFSPSSGDNSKMGWNTLHLPSCLRECSSRNGGSHTIQDKAESSINHPKHSLSPSLAICHSIQLSQPTKVLQQRGLSRGTRITSI